MQNHVAGRLCLCRISSLSLSRKWSRRSQQKASDWSTQLPRKRLNSKLLMIQQRTWSQSEAEVVESLAHSQEPVVLEATSLENADWDARLDFQESNVTRELASSMTTQAQIVKTIRFFFELACHYVASLPNLSCLQKVSKPPSLTNQILIVESSRTAE